MNHEPSDDHALDVRALAAWLSISEWKARELGKDPLFPSFKVGGRHRFWPSEVRTHLAQPRDPWKQSGPIPGSSESRASAAKHSSQAVPDPTAAVTGLIQSAEGCLAAFLPQNHL